MGYDIHITRKENWFDEDGVNEIKLNEWTSYIASDSEMRLEDQASSTNKIREGIKYKNNGLAVWTSYSKNGLEDNYAWFDYRAGNVTVKNPDEEIINKMIDIAGRVNAKVQGDDGETYEAKTSSMNKQGAQVKRRWWQSWS